MSALLTVALHKVSYLAAFIFLLAGKSIKNLNYVELFCKLSFKPFVHCQTKPQAKAKFILVPSAVLPASQRFKIFFSTQKILFFGCWVVVGNNQSRSCKVILKLKHLFMHTSV